MQVVSAQMLHILKAPHPHDLIHRNAYRDIGTAISQNAAHLPIIACYTEILSSRNSEV